MTHTIEDLQKYYDTELVPFTIDKNQRHGLSLDPKSMVREISMHGSNEFDGTFTEGYKYEFGIGNLGNKFVFAGTKLLYDGRAITAVGQIELGDKRYTVVRTDDTVPQLELLSLNDPSLSWPPSDSEDEAIFNRYCKATLDTDFRTAIADKLANKDSKAAEDLFSKD